MHCNELFGLFAPQKTPCDYFLWDYLKDKVYVNKSKTVDQLKNSIAEVWSEMIHQVMKNFRKIFQNCIENEVVFQKLEFCFVSHTSINM